MRTPAVAALLAMTGSFALSWAPAASASPGCETGPLGAAGNYAEFVEHDATRYADSEGAVAIGGDAHLGDAGTGQGFSVGSKLTDGDLNKLAGGHSLVVGGTLHANQVVLTRGSGVYGKLAPTASQGGFAVDGKHAQGSSPVDFGQEFAELRALSTGWAATTPNGTAARPEGSTALLLTGEDSAVNVFAVNATDLQQATEINVKVPAGSSALVNVLGSSYDMNSAPTYGVNLWDAQTGAFVQDDYAAGGPGFKDARSKLLWNFPEAASVVKNYTSWPGTILAPNATVELGRKGPGGEIGPGHVNGSVIARELRSVPGAETHHMDFTGCLPTVRAASGTTETSEAPAPPAPAPAASPEPTPVKVPEQPKPTPSATQPSPAPEPGPSVHGGGDDLASTGGELGPGAFGIGAAVLLVGGGLVAYSVHRRQARTSS
ncbi:choice-of-anchor A family protein [Streptomyces sp. NPDC091376]|uniref:choice-of-anchor A family protein n=1 Tax=Streptomyces sp. NPDC091376 TaxID=3365994 RepID=UPI0037F161ED